MPLGETLYRASQIGLLLLGSILWIRALLGGRVAQWLRQPSRLPAWSISLGDFLLLPFCSLVLLLLVPAGLAWLVGVKPSVEPSGTAALVASYGMGLSLVGGSLIFRLLPPARVARSPRGTGNPVIRGLLALVYFLPPCMALAYLADLVLRSLGYTPDLQVVVKIIRDTHDPLILAQWFFTVVILAPLGEELLFRAGIFRYLSNHLKPSLAAALSSALFATLHWNLQATLPLFALGLLLAGLYQKTGRLSAAIALHAAFNLNTFLGLLSGALS